MRELFLQLEKYSPIQDKFLSVTSVTTNKSLVRSHFQSTQVIQVLSATDKSLIRPII